MFSTQSKDFYFHVSQLLSPLVDFAADCAKVLVVEISLSQWFGFELVETRVEIVELGV
jgi:hypothetical protein